MLYMFQPIPARYLSYPFFLVLFVFESGLTAEVQAITLRKCHERLTSAFQRSQRLSSVSQIPCKTEGRIQLRNAKKKRKYDV